MLENIGDTEVINYNGSWQQVNITTKGIYKLEVFGGQGGKGSGSTGGLGGKSTGYKILNAGDIFYVTCGGGLNNKFNGGGDATANVTTWSGHGGGCTHISTVTGTLSSIGLANIDKVYLVAGGGGGAGEQATRHGGSGGGEFGGAGKPSSVYKIHPASQTNGGYNSYYGNNQSHYTHGQFGKGGNAETKASFESGVYRGGGGGGGFYGGGGGLYSTNASNNTSGSGGSGWIGGVPQFTFNGNTYKPSTEIGINSGNGKAIITLVDIIKYVSISYNTSLGTVTGEGDYSINSEVTVTATPGSNFMFVCWYDKNTGTVVDSNESYTFTITDDMSLEAVFSQKVIVTKNIEYAGSVTKELVLYDDISNECEVKFTSSSPWIDHKFIGWYINGTLVSSSSTYTHRYSILPNDDIEIEAKWEKITIPVKYPNDTMICY